MAHSRYIGTIHQPTIDRRVALHALGLLLAWAAIGALLIGLAYQIPASHTVTIGRNDAAYVQGMSDPLNRWGVVDPQTNADTPLRWTGPRSAIIFPQIGLPATATLRWRALRPPDQPLPTVRVLLNGRDELAAIPASGDWETHTVAIDGGLLKPNDLFLELHVEPPFEQDGIPRGVQIDRAELATGGWPIVPFPAQLLYGAAAIGLAAPLFRRRATRIGVALGIALIWLLLYRLGLTPFPIRSLLPMLAVIFAAIWLVRLLPFLASRRSIVVITIVMPGAIWAVWLLLASRQHTALSIPGVERDFPVFVTRATALLCDRSIANAPCVLRADGFYQIGYPLLLWLATPLTGDPFVAGKMIAALSGLALLGATAWLGWRIVGAWGALIAALVLALSPLVVQYSLFVGTDMPFAALWALALAALFEYARGRRTADDGRRAADDGAFTTDASVAQSAARGASLIAAGLLCGGAFLIRHPGLVLLPFGWIVIMVAARGAWRGSWRQALVFSLAWLIAVSPQIAVNVADTGQPLYSQQAKNIWLAVYGNIDYSRWDEAANDVSLADLVLADPPRFFGNWGRNLRAFVGSGAEDTGEFGRAIGLRLLGAPANWLAVIGVLLWLIRGDRRVRLLLAGAALYIVGVSVGFALPRFFVPIAPIAAVACAAALLWLADRCARRWARLDRRQWRALALLVLLPFLLGGPRIGVRAMLDRQPDAQSSSVTVINRP